MSENTIAERYVLQEEIGSGGMGVVYRALDKRSSQTVAIKQIKPGAASPDQITRFKREGDLLRELDHPNIIRLLDTFEHEGQHHLVMRYIEGGNLSQRMAQQPLAVEQVIRIGIDLADALTQAHKLNVIHRDLKPANVLIASNNTVYLTDFGLAQIAGQKGITSTGAIVGTIDYLPPEAFSESPRDARGDIWSFGVMLAEMLTGTNPFTRSTLLETMWAITSEPPPNLEAIAGSEAIALIDLIYRMLERDPGARIASVRHVGAALEDISRGGGGDSTATNRFNTPTSEVLRNVRHNLPQPTTPFVGRENELQELYSLLRDPQRRLITVMAPGGMGKTRLALEAGRQMLAEFSDGVYFVNLAPLSGVDAVAPAVAEAVGFRFQPDSRSQWQQVLDFLRDKVLLLIFDNFEHMIDGVSLVNDVLQNAPHSKALITSRQRLSHPAESLFRLSHMAFPDRPGLVEPSAYAAVTLFVRSAERVRPDFELTAENADAVTRICRTVEGLPLGIVLAVSWLSLLSPDEIADELAHSIDILDADLPGLPERQRGIRAAFDYSWKLLSPDEQAVFVRLSVFRGGFTREAAQAVSGARLHTLMMLLNKSLLHRDIATGRFSLHELMRQYGAEKLAASAHVTPTRHAHRDYYLHALEKMIAPLRTNGQLAALDAIEVDFENIRLAWYEAISGREWALLGSAAESLFHFARTRNRQRDVNALFDRVLYDEQDVESPEQRLGLARVLLWSTMTNTGTIATPDLEQIAHQLARVGALLSPPDVAAQAATERWLAAYQDVRRAVNTGITPPHADSARHLVEWAERLNDRWLLALGHHILGYINIVIDAEVALRATQAAYDEFKALGNLSWTSMLANNLAVLMMSVQDYDRAEPYLDECIDVYRTLRDEVRAAHSLCVRGNMNLARATFDEAERDFREAIPIARDLNYSTGVSLACNGLGFLAFLNGNRDEAGRYLRESLDAIATISSISDRMMGTVVARTLLVLLDDVTNPVNALSEMAPFVRRLPSAPYNWFFVIAVIHVLATQGESRRAAEIAGTLHTKGKLSAGFQRLIAPTLAQVREALGPAAYDAAWRQGEVVTDFAALIQTLLDEFDPH